MRPDQLFAKGYQRFDAKPNSFSVPTGVCHNLNPDLWEGIFIFARRTDIIYIEIEVLTKSSTSIS
jgi:hypothetical protein